MLTVILDALVPVFFVLALGYLAGRTRDIDNTHVAELNSLIMDFAVPIAIFVAVSTASRTTLVQQIPLAIILAVSMLIVYGATYFIIRRVNKLTPAEASIQALTTSLPNYASAGLPLIAALLGPTHVVSVAVSIACGAIVVSPLTLVILEATSQKAGERHLWLVLYRALRKPIVLAPVLAVLFVVSGAELPTLAVKSLNLIGQVAGGAALFLTGLILSAQKLRIGRSAGLQTLAANVVHPLIAAGLAWLFAVSPLTAREAIVLSALPTGFFGILFGLRFGLRSEVVGATLLASTVLSAITLAAAIYFTAGLV